MEFRIADTFTDSLVRLSGDEQKAVKTTAFDLQMNPAQPGMQFHRLDRALDKRFWSVRVNADVRLIVHKTENSLLLCYVDHHDPAYRWAERRKLQTHPKTGAAQLVEIREIVEEIIVTRQVTAGPSMPVKPPLFAHMPPDDLLTYGVPDEWLTEVFQATEDTLLELVDHLPAEAAEALLDLAVGVTPTKAKPVDATGDPFAHPDALRRFRVMHNADELAQALDYPWEKWTTFLHPEQRQLVERQYNGPARVAGSAGTGKTIVALHRAVFLARANPDARVLLTTFSQSLANALRTKLRRLLASEPRLGDRLEVHAMSVIGQRLYEKHVNKPKLVSDDDLRRVIQETAHAVPDHRFSLRFLLTEWAEVVDAWQLDSWEAYRDVKRLGRKTRLPEAQRLVLWTIFDQVRNRLADRQQITEAAMFSRLAVRIAAGKHPPFEFVVVDEAQDVSIAQLRFLAALGATRPDGLFFAGDIGQRIFQQPFSWKSLGVDVRGRSRSLRVNYRMSHQIRLQADRLLPPEVADVDGNTEGRQGTISVFNGPEPSIRMLDTPEQEIRTVSDWLLARNSEGILPHEMALFVRSDAEFDRASAAAEAAGLPFTVLDDKVETISGRLSISTMHLAKGLEFRVVAVMACDDEILPSSERLANVGDDADLEEVYDTERHLLYVACTRARDQLLVTSGGIPSEFLDDLRPIP